MKISIIVAIDENNLIGSKNKLPWYLPADLKHFKEVTMGHHIVFGQKTHKSIGRPLPGRTNIILSDNLSYQSKGCIVAHSVNETILFAKKNKEKELFICGGAMVYKTFLPFADRIYLTKIYHKFEGDIYFPKINFSKWKKVFSEKHKSDAKNPYPYEFIILERK